MTLTQLRTLLVIATAGSFSAAAVQLGMAQPSVSELVKRMEETYGVRLFHRSSRGLVLTPAGEALMPHAQRAVEAADAADRALRDLTSLQGGVATFGLLRNANYYFLSRLLDRFHAQYPEVRLRVIGLNSVEVAEAVAAGELEAGLVVLPIDAESLEVTPLRRDDVLFASADPAKTARPVTIEDLAATDLVLYDAHYGWRDPTRRQLAERAQLAGVSLLPRIEVEHIDSALDLVARGAGDTIVSGAVAAGRTFPAGVHTVPFADPLYDTIALVQRAGVPLSPATRELAQLARTMLLER
ncbi:LysR family transcriptional regulator [Curtobacterium sp. L1-20]|uniref:LysR family transcriptional regulator n=1 Tax=Curtobacterium sp. L1-20 TaxID=3138181 RepID=UPI003B5168C2